MGDDDDDGQDEHGQTDEDDEEEEEEDGEEDDDDSDDDDDEDEEENENRGEYECAHSNSQDGDLSDEHKSKLVLTELEPKYLASSSSSSVGELSKKRGREEKRETTSDKVETTNTKYKNKKSKLSNRQSTSCQKSINQVLKQEKYSAQATIEQQQSVQPDINYTSGKRTDSTKSSILEKYSSEHHQQPASKIYRNQYSSASWSQQQQQQQQERELNHNQQHRLASTDRIEHHHLTQAGVGCADANSWTASLYGQNLQVGREEENYPFVANTLNEAHNSHHQYTNTSNYLTSVVNSPPAQLDQFDDFNSKRQHQLTGLGQAEHQKQSPLESANNNSEQNNSSSSNNEYNQLR